MRDLNQSIIQFDYEQKFTEDDFIYQKAMNIFSYF